MAHQGPSHHAALASGPLLGHLGPAPAPSSLGPYRSGPHDPPTLPPLSLHKELIIFKYLNDLYSITRNANGKGESIINGSRAFPNAHTANTLCRHIRTQERQSPHTVLTYRYRGCSQHSPALAVPPRHRSPHAPGRWRPGYICPARSRPARNTAGRGTQHFAQRQPNAVQQHECRILQHARRAK